MKKRRLEEQKEKDRLENIIDPTKAAKDAVGDTNNITSLSDFVAAKDKADKKEKLVLIWHN